jgi:RNA polymerase sporulation-specific sigma factor
LSSLSDEDLVALAKSGEEQAIEILLDRYRHYARAKARLYFLAGADREDVVQEGMIGLFKAVRDFDASKNTAFRAFAEMCITRQIITAIKSATRQKHLPLNTYVSLSKPMSAGSGDDHVLESTLDSHLEADPADLVVSAEEIEAINASVADVLSELEGEVLHLYMDGKSYQEIADRLGRHVKSIDNALQRIKRKLEGRLGRSAAASTG